jgi:hypothetical protein
MESVAMRARPLPVCLAALTVGGALSAAAWLGAQEPAAQPPPLGPPISSTPAPVAPAAEKSAESADAPKGVEVLARGPVHEAFATPTSEPQPTAPVAKKPPAPIEELPPEQKPEGDVQWIGGYWAWDDDRADYLWVSGVWRTPPPGKHWVAGYWRADGDKWQWVPGFWAEAHTDGDKHDLTYLPKPPDAPETAPAGPPPNGDSFWVPGQYEWAGDRYAWRAGYWGHVEPGYVWVPAHFRWTPYGYVYIRGYWDLALTRRGVIYAPVVIDPAVVTVGYVYTPAYVVPDTVVVDAFFVRPCCCHYYFGDYYGPVYRDRGFESVVVYSQRHYDSVIVYERWEHRADPRWEVVQVNVYRDRYAGRAPCPPRTLVQERVWVRDHPGRAAPGLAPASQLASVKGVRTLPLDASARSQVRQQSQALQQVAVQRREYEAKMPAGAPARPHVASLPIARPSPAVPRSAVPDPHHPGPGMTPDPSAPRGHGLTPAPGLPVVPHAPGGPPQQNAGQGGRPGQPPSKPLPPKPPPPKQPPPKQPPPKQPPADGR